MPAFVAEDVGIRAAAMPGMDEGTTTESAGKDDTTVEEFSLVGTIDEDPTAE